MFRRVIFSSVSQCKCWVEAKVKCRCGLFDRKVGEGRLQWQSPLGIPSLAGPAWSLCQAVCEQKQLSHSGEPCPDGWEQSRVRFGRAVCSGVPPVSDCRQNRRPGFFCVSLFVSPHTSKKHVCVQKAFSGSHFYNEKSSREVQLNKLCVSVTVTELCPSQSKAADWDFTGLCALQQLQNRLMQAVGVPCCNSSPLPALLPTAVTCTVKALMLYW